MANYVRPETKGFPSSQLVREVPSADRINGLRDQVDSLGNRYMKFIGAAVTPPSTTKEVIKLAQKKGYRDRPSGTNPYFILGPDEKSFALVSPGRKPLSEGVRIISSHTDSPCLILKQRPLEFNWDPDEKELNAGVLLSTTPYGGIEEYQWSGTDVKVHIHTIRNRRRIEKTLDGFIYGYSVHLDRREDDKSVDPELLKVFTGHRSRKSLLNALNFKDEEEFFRSTGYVVPAKSPIRIEKDYIVAYGHDDKAGTFAAVDALLRSRKNYTSVVIGFDFEETGCDGQGGAKGNFFEDILETIIEKSRTKIKRRELIKKSQGISADVDISSGLPEGGDSKIIDPRNISRLGYGVSVFTQQGLEEGINVSIAYADHIKNLIDKEKIRAQLVGTGELADISMGSMTTGYFLERKGLDIIDSGPPIASSHNTSEMLFVPDLYWTREFYKKFLENKKPYDRSPPKKR